MSISSLNAATPTGLNVNAAYAPSTGGQSLFGQGGSDSVTITQPRANDSGSLSSPAPTRSGVIKGKNLTVEKTADAITLTWDYGKADGGKQTVAFDTQSFDACLGKDVPGLHSRFKNHVCLVDKSTGQIEIYEKGHYLLFEPGQSKGIKAQQRHFTPHHVVAAANGSRMDVAV